MIAVTVLFSSMQRINLTVIKLKNKILLKKFYAQK